LLCEKFALSLTLLASLYENDIIYYIITRYFNGIFQKDIKEKGIYGGKKETGYYPASMEYGFKTKKGQIGGHHFLEIVGRREESGIQDKMLEIISKEIDKLEKKKASNSNS
jgi:hypothetical protein